MFIELNPGTPAAPLAKENWTMPIANTLPDVNPDEFLSSLDADTRDYLKLLLNGAGRGLKGRSDDLREVLKRFEPTYRDLAKVSTAVKRSTEGPPAPDQQPRSASTVSWPARTTSSPS